jgi:photosystem II stability/assembly factor-like uncharacterized protein
MTAASRRSYVFVGAARWVSGTVGGVFRQAVGDDDWEPLTRGLPEPVAVQALTGHPTARGLLYAGTQDGPYRTTDGGAHWERGDFPRGLEVWSVAVHPRDRGVVYAGTSPVGVWRSEDSGETWRRLPGAVQRERLTMSFACRVMRLAIVPGPPDALYAALEVAGVMRSLDGGEHWDDCADDLVALAERPHLRSRLQSDSDAEGMLDAHALCVSPAAPDTVFLAVRMGLFRSDDRGRSWRDLEIGRVSPLTYARDVRVSPHDPAVLYACLSPASRSEDGALWRSDDLGRTWGRFDHGIAPRATMMAVAPDPVDAALVHGVSRGGQVFTTRDGGRSWRQSRLPPGVDDVYAVAAG